MAIRKTTIKAKIDQAIAQIGKNRCDAAKATLVSLEEKLSGAEVKRKPGKYAIFVKSNFARVQKEHPKMTAPQVMKQIAVEWSKTNKK
jgi:hypothetical protein